MTQVVRPSVQWRAVCAALFVALVVGLVVGGVQTGGWVCVAAMVGAAAASVFCWRFWVLGVEDRGDSLRFVSWTRTLDLRWSDVKRFEHNGAGVSLRTRQKTAIAISAFPEPFRDVFGVQRRRNRAAYLALEAMRKERGRRVPKGS